MKHSLSILLLSLLVAVACTNSAQPTSDVGVSAAPARIGWSEELPKLRGEVDSVRMVIEEPEHTTIYKYIYKFNQRGDVEEVLTLFSDDTPNDKWLYKYDDNGRKKELAWYRDEGPFWQTCRYKYDEQGNMVESRESTDDAMLNRIIYSYDEQGRISEMTYCDDDGNVSGRIYCKYDSEGREIERTQCSESGEVYYTYLYKYDTYGNMIEWIGYGTDNNKSYERYNYDSYNNKVEIIADDWIGHYKYKYDSTGNVVECREYNGKENILRRVVKFKISYRQ